MFPENSYWGNNRLLNSSFVTLSWIQVCAHPITQYLFSISSPSQRGLIDPTDPGHSLSIHPSTGMKGYILLTHVAAKYTTATDPTALWDLRKGLSLAFPYEVLRSQRVAVLYEHRPLSDTKAILTPAIGSIWYHYYFHLLQHIPRSAQVTETPQEPPDSSPPHPPLSVFHRLWFNTSQAHSQPSCNPRAWHVGRTHSHLPVPYSGNMWKCSSKVPEPGLWRTGRTCLPYPELLSLPLTLSMLFLFLFLIKYIRTNRPSHLWAICPQPILPLVEYLSKTDPCCHQTSHHSQYIIVGSRERNPQVLLFNNPRTSRYWELILVRNRDVLEHAPREFTRLPPTCSSY